MPRRKKTEEPTAPEVKTDYPEAMTVVGKTAYFNRESGEWFFYESQAIKAFGPGNYEVYTPPAE